MKSLNFKDIESWNQQYIHGQTKKTVGCFCFSIWIWIRKSGNSQLFKLTWIDYRLRPLNWRSSRCMRFEVSSLITISCEIHFYKKRRLFQKGLLPIVGIQPTSGRQSTRVLYLERRQIHFKSLRNLNSFYLLKNWLFTLRKFDL